MTSLTHKLANSRKTRAQIRKRVSELKSTANFTLNEPNLFLRVSSPLMYALEIALGFALLHEFLLVFLRILHGALCTFG